VNNNSFFREKPKSITVDGKEHIKFKSELGKIDSIEFGKCYDYPFILGVKISFKGDGTGVFSDVSMNMGETCKWDYPKQRQETAEDIMQFIYDILEDAKKQNLSQLEGVPVEMYFNMETNFILGILIGFRILKEVL
jgi:hypothetical protein